MSFFEQIAGGTIGSVTNVGSLTNAGTIKEITNIAGGTVVTSGAIGTFTSGTINAGTIQINQTPVNLGTPFSTYGTTGAAVWGTIVAASGAGTKQYIENVDIVVHSGTVDVVVTNIGVGGATGAGVLARGAFPAGGGIQRSFFPPVASGTNGTISYWLGGAGTVSIDIVYWQGA